MFHKIKNVFPLPEYRLSIQFAEGRTKIYDAIPLFDEIPVFKKLKDLNLFSQVYVDVDGLMALSDATALWCLNESTLRKAISYGKLIEGVDVCKFGEFNR